MPRNPGSALAFEEVGTNKISIDQAPEWVKKLGEKRRKAAMKGLLSAAHRLVGVINEIIEAEPRKPVDRGIYKAGWRVRKETDGVLVFNATPHASFIEDGVRGDHVRVGRAMVDAIAAWVQRKGLTGSAKKEEAPMEARRIAWAIVQSMKKKGIFGDGKGLKILARARKRIPELIDEEVKAELERASKG